jgi:type VI secretion system secreted protein Hcp
MPIYMRITQNGKLITKGDATARGHENWIELSSAQMGKTTSIADMEKALEKDPNASLGISEIVITKVLDPASTTLFQQSLKNGDGLTAQIDFVKPSEKKGAPPSTYLSYTLQDVLVSRYQVVDRTESITLNFAKANIHKQASADDSNLAKAIVRSYNRRPRGQP